MRIEITIILAILLIVSLCLWTNHTIVESCETLNKISQNIRTALTTDNWSLALDFTAGLADSLQQIHFLWSLMISHRHLEELEILISRLQTEVKEKSRTDALNTAKELQLRLEFIARDEIVNIRNIF